MKWLSALLFLFCSMLFVSAQPSLKEAQRVTISGTEYIRLRDWSEATGLTVRWIKQDESLLVSNKWCRIELQVKSILSKFNGMDLRLSLPVVSQNGGVYISSIDVNHTLHPLLYPSRNPSTDKVTTICIDPGHGGDDKGKIDKFHYEKRYTLLLADEMSRLLKEQGFKVIFTRTKDRYLTLAERVSSANRNNADLFVSLHFNAASTPHVRGSEVYSMTPAGVESSNSGPGRSTSGAYTGNRNNSKNMLLAYTVQRSILRNTGLMDRGLKRARFEVLRDVKMPAVLVESGFMTSPDDSKKIYDADFRKKLAKSIVDGIVAYKKIVDSPAATTQAITALN